VTEFVGTSMTSQFGPSPAQVDLVLRDNPHVRLADGTRRGYVRVEVTGQRLRADLRAMRTVTQPRADADTLASFVVEDGRPGAARA
jgi:alkaline phosphatase D